MWHMTFCSVVGFLCVRVLGVARSHNMPARDYARRVLPIGVLYAASLWLSNTAYLSLSVSFIQMTKSLMPGLVYACGVALGVEEFRAASAANMALIAFGVVVCALGERALVLSGLAQQLAALLFEAARLTLVQVLMTRRGLAMNPLQSLYYVSPACLLCLLAPFGGCRPACKAPLRPAPRGERSPLPLAPPCRAAPPPRCAASPHRLAIRAPPAAAVELRPMLAAPPVFRPPVLLANALAAFALNLAVFLLIGKTSALTMNIAGVIKDWMLIFFSYYVFKAPLTRLNLAGYAFCCSGVGVYNYQKLQLMKRKALQKAKEEGTASADSGGGAKGKDEEGQPLLRSSNGNTPTAAAAAKAS